MAWTLVQSFQYTLRVNYSNIPFYQDKPRNQDSPAWEDYRLSWSRMENIHKDSNSKWRFTCNFDKDGLVRTDYVVATHADIPILPSGSQHEGCKKVEFIDIRGNNCTNCKILIAQSDVWSLHIDSYHTEVYCKPTTFPNRKECGKDGEDNFGLYACVNHEHRCSSTDESTTQVWFGGQ
jgi:hypothetical protein